MNRIDYEIDRDFGKHWSGRNSEREYHLIEKSHHDFFGDKIRNTETRLGELSSKPISSKEKTSFYAGLKVDLEELLSKEAKNFGLTVKLKFGTLTEITSGEKGKRFCLEIKKGLSSKMPTLSDVERIFKGPPWKTRAHTY